MPELPEVETVRRTLYNKILNEKIKSVEVRYTKILENTTKEEFETILVGEKLTNIRRYAKYLIFIFENVSIIAHLRMEGKFFIKDENEELALHEHVIFTFYSGKTLRYHDTRKFGKMALIKDVDIKKIMEYPSLKKLGIEANSALLTPSYLEEKLKHHKEPVKALLLNQEIISGIGNIYADEILFKCKLSPLMSASKINKDDILNIISSSKTILNEAISLGGTTIRSYTSSLGVTGRFQINLKVHTKEGLPCPSCGTLIKKITVSGRGTYYCPNCQRDRLPKVIGITGGIAMGKSTVTSYLQKNGFKVVDADKIANKLNQQKSVIEMLSTTFGDEIIKSGKIDKALLGSLIYNDPKKKELLNNIIHPLVYNKIKEEINLCTDNVIFIDVPLLYEAGFDKLCDYVIVVKTNKEENVKRLMNRDNIDEEYAYIKIASQMDIEKKCQLANFIIENSFDLCYTYKQIDEVLKTLNL